MNMKLHEPARGNFHCYDLRTCEYEQERGWIIPMLCEPNVDDAMQKVLLMTGWNVQDLDSFRDLCLHHSLEIVLTSKGLRLLIQ